MDLNMFPALDRKLESSAGTPPAPLLVPSGDIFSESRNPSTANAPSRLLVALGGALHSAAETRHFFSVSVETVTLDVRRVHAAL